MIIRYEYSSDCCNHIYMETRSEEQGQVINQCNVCGQGQYQLITEVVIGEAIPPAVSFPFEEQTV